MKDPSLRMPLILVALAFLVQGQSCTAKSHGAQVTKQKKKDKKAGKVDKSRKGEDDLNIAYVRDQYGAKAYDMYRRTGKKFDPASIDEGLEDH